MKEDTNIGKKSMKQNPFLYSKLTHQLSFKNLNLKVDHHAWGKLFIHGHKCLKGKSL